MASATGSPPSDADRDRLVGVAFTRARLRQGYDIGQVDAFISRVVHDLGSPESAMHAAEVREVQFRPVMLRESYDMREVDGYLDELERQLADRHPEPRPDVRQPPRPALLVLMGSVAAWGRRLTWTLTLLLVLVWVLVETLPR